ncbi:hypothetical protein FQN54_005404 [Arachnomyces sp. PD_36]|nr:hypothetical protein FQN54_005404 [Arachnomyces sp. PD_36]
MQSQEERSPREVPQQQTQLPQLPSVPTETMAAAMATAAPAVSAPPATIQNIAEPDRTSAMVLDNNTNNKNHEDRTRATSVLSIDDIEAAQALEGLRTGKLGRELTGNHEDIGADALSSLDFVQSPPSHGSRPSQSVTPTSEPRQPEPLLALLTSTHPLLSTAINGSMTAYTTSKSYSPRFKSGAEFLERNIAPVASTVGTVGRKTGVEGGIRWALQFRGGDRSEASSGGQRRSKRRKVSEDTRGQFDIEKGMLDASMTPRTRRSSDLSHAETLPPYDSNTSPNYEDIGRLAISTKEDEEPTQAPTWQTRLMISTSGLSVAMSEESLRSLSYCLTWLQWANDRLGKSIISLKDVLKEWENAQAQQSQDNPGGAEANSQSRAALLERIQQVKGDVLHTLKQAVDIVSKYAGGALPENARNLVRRHLTSLPQRFRIASTSTPPPESSASTSEMGTSAHRVLVLAQEGLDMMAQVSGVVNDTLTSAEDWCEKLGRKKPEMRQAEAGGTDEKRKEPGGEEQEKSEPRPTDEKRPLPQDIEMTGAESKV